ncbi:MAG: DUF3352 domain-containing protein [Deltaproteobacteria bacterium]|nr:DUF3352 domain-containing protein [Deltaproteobacteria bacterium]
MAGVLTFGACGKDEPAKQPTAAAPTTATTAAAAPDAGTEGGTPPKGPETPEPRRDLDIAVTPATGAFAAPFLARLSKDTLAVGVGTPKALIDGLGLEALIAQYAEQSKELVEASMAATGKNLLDLATWPTIGVDLQGPAGVASLDAQKEGVVIFATLSDAAAFRALFDELAKRAEKTLKEEKVGDATLLELDGRDRTVVLIGDKWMAFVALDRGNGAAAIAKELATATPEQSLAGTPEFKQAVSGLASDEAGAYVNLGTIAKVLTAVRGDPSRRDEDEAELFDMVLGDLRGLAFGLDLTAESVEASMRLPLPEGALLKKLLANTTGVFPIVKATTEMPLFLAAARIDLPGYMSIIDKMMAADGVSLDEVKGQMKEFVGVDLDKDVLSLFNGEMGIAVLGDIQAMMASDDAPWSKLGGGLTIGLANPDGMKAMMARLGGMKQLERVVRFDAATGAMTVPLPIDMTLTIQVAGSHLVVSTTPALAERIASGDAAGSFTAGLTNARLKALVDRPELAGLVLMPQTLGAGWLMVAKGSDYRPSFPPPSDPALTPKYDEYMKLRRELDEEQEASEKKSMEAIMAVLDKVGVTGEAIAVKPDAIEATIGQYTKGATVPEVVAEIVKLRAMGEGMDGSDDARRAKLEKLWALESELRMPTEVKTIEAVPAPPENP